VPIKITVALPDDLARLLKAEAALRGCKMKELIEKGLRLVLDTPRTAGRETSLPTLYDLMQGARGVVNSGLANLGSDPIFLKGFGGALHRRR